MVLADPRVDTSSCSDSAESFQENEVQINCTNCRVTKAVFDSLSETRKIFFISPSGQCRLCGMDINSHYNPAKLAATLQPTRPMPERLGLPWVEEELLFLRVFLRQTSTVSDIDHDLLQVTWNKLMFPVRSRLAFHKKILHLRSQAMDPAAYEEAERRLKARLGHL